MAAVAPDAERRRCARFPCETTAWHARAIVRPGQDVVVVNIGAHGALVESSGRLRPGLRTAVQLVGRSEKSEVLGRIDRCEVVGLAPIRYRAVIAFDEAIEIITEPEPSAVG